MTSEKSSSSDNASSKEEEALSSSSSSISSNNGHQSEESAINSTASEAAKIMSVDQARNLMRDSGISDGAFSNNDINKYIIEANKKHKDFIEYLKSLGF